MKKWIGQLWQVVLRAYHFFKQGRERPIWLQYSCATFWTLAGLLCRSLLGNILGAEAPFAVFTLFILVVAWGSGMGPALYALALSVALVDYFFFPDIRLLGIGGLARWLSVMSYVMPALFGILLIESLHRTQVHLTRQKTAAEAEANRRRRAEAELDDARRQLRDYAIDLEATVRTRTSELSEAVGFLENFCYSIAHDLRAPLRSISGFSRLLMEESRSEISEHAAEYVQRINASTLHMNRLITGLLEFGRLSHLEVKPQSVDLHKAIGEALVCFECKIQEMGATVQIAEQLGAVWADTNLVHAILRELIENAFQFAHPERKLQLTFAAVVQDHMVRLWVCDNGIGIEAPYQQKVFGLFQTLHAQDQLHCGTGLAIVAKAAERLHGAAGVQSIPGEGCKFWIDLPRHEWRRIARPRPERALSETTKL